MNTRPFEFDPLGHVVHGLESSEDLSPDQVNAELVANGYDPEALTARIQARVRALSVASRLGWMEAGRAAQTRLDEVLTGLRTWTRRSKAAVNEAFNDVLAGRYGNEPQLRLRTAFSNLHEVTDESKAAFLDEVDALLALSKAKQDEERSSGT